MLKIYFGSMPEEESIYNTSIYFDNTYEDEWITSPLSKEIIRDIDHSEVLSSQCIMSPVLGQIPPVQLSGGTKTLILVMNEPETIFNASTCGDNCAKWLLRIGSEMDVTVNLGHFMDFGDDPFEIYIENNGKTIYCIEEMFQVVDEFL